MYTGSEEPGACPNSSEVGDNGITGQTLWLVASVLANPMTPWLLKMTNLMTLYPTKSLVYGDTSSLIT